MFAVVVGILAAFYAGAVVITGHAWLCVWRSRVRYAALRDLTGIADRAVLRRFFGLAGADGVYRVSLAELMRRRRRVGIIVSDFPLHLLFLLALASCWLGWSAPVEAAVVCVASLHAAVVGTAALVIAIGNRQLIAP